MKKLSLLTIFIVFMVGGAAYSDSGFHSPSVAGTGNITLPEFGAIVFDTTNGVFWGNNSLPTSPNWIPLSSLSQNFASGYFDIHYSWSMTTATASFFNFNNVAAGTFNVVNQSFIAVTEPSGHGLGLTYSPSSSSSVYKITFAVPCDNAGGGAASFRLYDVTNNLEVDEAYTTTAGHFILSGFYAPGTTLPVTILVQGAAALGTGPLNCGATLGVEGAVWDIQQVK
jgi:hypothetical protein